MMIKPDQPKKRIAILGGGPSALFIFKRLVDTGDVHVDISVFEARTELGSGMPYSAEGANTEHVTNVSANEIPQLVTSLADWIKTISPDTLRNFGLDPARFTEYKVLPRLLFGQYLGAQFDLLLKKAKATGMTTTIHFKSEVTDIIDVPANNSVTVEVNGANRYEFDGIVLCTGHNWPRTHEGIIPGYFDSPYPPAKLAVFVNHPVAMRGASLTAIDAIRTLARQHGSFIAGEGNKLLFEPHAEAPAFKMVMHSLHALLPAIRFHLEDPHLSKDDLLTPAELKQNREANNGFLSLDFLFENDFKEAIRKKEPEFYETIREMTIEDFVASMMELREKVDPFLFFKGEYAEAEKSILRKKSVYWKEMLAVLSFAMNYPAKHFSAEDMQRLRRVLMPLISIVIAFVPQQSAAELIALHEAGRLELVGVDEKSTIELLEEGGIIYNYKNEDGQPQSIPYKTFVDCVGQPHLSIDAFPFKGLVEGGTVTPARVKFRSAEEARTQLEKGTRGIEVTGGEYYLRLPGIAINDNFQAVDKYGAYNPRIYIMAVPYIGGFNPDYSGLDFCEEASKIILSALRAALLQPQV